VAVALRCDNGCLTDLRIACTGTNAFPLSLRGLETLRGRCVDAGSLAQVDKLFEEQINIMETTVASSLYRRRVAMRLIHRVLVRLAAQ
jgi:CO/xanthine dehydrogenase FAD-binding subunit